jgi:hypothetical protein
VRLPHRIDVLLVVAASAVLAGLVFALIAFLAPDRTPSSTGPGPATSKPSAPDIPAPNIPASRIPAPPESVPVPAAGDGSPVEPHVGGN